MEVMLLIVHKFILEFWVICGYFKVIFAIDIQQMPKPVLYYKPNLNASLCLWEMAENYVCVSEEIFINTLLTMRGPKSQSSELYINLDQILKSTIYSSQASYTKFHSRKERRLLE